MERLGGGFPPWQITCEGRSRHPKESVHAMSESPLHDVVALGELVIDLVPTRDADGQLCFAPKPGGAPGNVAVGVARLGGRAAMLSKVGEEAFGRLLIATLAGNGVLTEGVLSTRDGNTSLAVVTVAPDGDRDFMLYRNGCAESTYAPAEVAVDIIRTSRILHVGSLILGQPVSAASQRHAVRVAQEAGVPVSVDVNLRASMWRDTADMRAAALEAAGVADILKVSEEELAFLTGTSDLSDGIAKLWRPRLRVMAVTMGAAGALLATAWHRARVPGFAVKVVDTVGCGDAFSASLLADLAVSQADLGSIAGLERLARRACAAGAITATTAGAMESLPTTARRDTFLASHESSSPASSASKRSERPRLDL
jgi:fructokinase